MNALFSAFERASMWGLIALLVALAAQVVLDGRVPASWRVWMWRVALLQTALALIPPATLRLAVLPPRPLVAAPAHPTFAAPPSIRRELTVAPVAPSVAPRQKVAPLRVRVASSPAARPNWKWAFASIYASGLVIRLAILANCFARVRRLLHACNAVDEANASESLREIARRMPVSPLPRLLDSETSAPCLVGIRRPAIVLPRSLLTPQNPGLAAVLSHELAHLKRRDLNWNAVLWPIQTLFWFHPLVWCARWFLALETESACDEITLSSTRVAPQTYGALILNTMNNPTTPLTAGITDGFFTLKKRLARLSQAPKRPRRALRVAFAGGLCIALGASVPLRLVARAQNQPQPAAVATKVQATTNPYKVTRRIPQNDTPETEVGLPATLEEALKRANTTISGRVVYENGKPAAGLKVMTFCVWNAQTELWGYHRNQANHYRWPDKINKLLFGITRTRADGTYRFTGLLPQRYSIHIWSDKLGNSAPVGWLPPYRGVGVTTVANQTRRAQDTILRRSAQIRIRAVDQDSGAPLEGVMFLGFIVNESGEKITNLTVDAHQGSRPSKGFMDEQSTDENGYCTLDLEGGKAYFFMTGGNYMGNLAGEKEEPGLPSRFITTQGLYKSQTWCEVTALAPASQRQSAPRRAWKGETEFQLKKGLPANFVIRLKRDKALTPEYKSLLKLIKKQFYPKRS